MSINIPTRMDLKRERERESYPAIKLSHSRYTPKEWTPYLPILVVRIKTEFTERDNKC